jgi:hypothetical protein
VVPPTNLVPIVIAVMILAVATMTIPAFVAVVMLAIAMAMFAGNRRTG